MENLLATARSSVVFAFREHRNMELDQAESRLGISLRERHRNVMIDPTDPMHDACDFFVPDSPHQLLRWVDVNEFLHAADRRNCWPTFLSHLRQTVSATTLRTTLVRSPQRSSTLTQTVRSTIILRRPMGLNLRALTRGMT